MVICQLQFVRTSCDNIQHSILISPKEILLKAENLPFHGLARGKMSEITCFGEEHDLGLLFDLSCLMVCLLRFEAIISE